MAGASDALSLSITSRDLIIILSIQTNSHTEASLHIEYQDPIFGIKAPLASQ